MSPDITDAAPPDDQICWHVVIPVKEAEQAKSRLEAPLPLRRADLARAVATDTIETACAALGRGQLTVVTSDAVVRRAALGVGARVVDDPALGLNAAVAAGWRDVPGPVGRRSGWAALLGDLPALGADDLRAALEACGRQPRALVPDVEGTGTVLLTSTAAPPVPRFGPGSAARHADDGAVILELDLPGLRRDVDLVDDLRTAVALGVGRHTRLALQQGA